MQSPTNPEIAAPYIEGKLKADVLATCSVLCQQGKLKPAVFLHAFISKTFSLVPHLPCSRQTMHQSRGVILTPAECTYKYFQEKYPTLAFLYVILEILPETG